MTRRFRVWCLSWEKNEENGMDVVEVDLLTMAAKPTNPRVIEVYTGLDAETAAEAYAHYVHDNRDGYECTWPLLFRVCGSDGAFQDFEVDRDYEPTFNAAIRSRNT